MQNPIAMNYSIISEDIPRRGLAYTVAAIISASSSCKLRTMAHFVVILATTEIIMMVIMIQVPKLSKGPRWVESIRGGMVFDIRAYTHEG